MFLPTAVTELAFLTAQPGARTTGTRQQSLFDFVYSGYFYMFHSVINNKALILASTTEIAANNIRNIRIKLLRSHLSHRSIRHLGNDLEFDVQKLHQNILSSLLPWLPTLSSLCFDDVPYQQVRYRGGRTACIGLQHPSTWLQSLKICHLVIQI